MIQKKKKTKLKTKTKKNFYMPLEVDTLTVNQFVNDNLSTTTMTDCIVPTTQMNSEANFSPHSPDKNPTQMMTFRLQLCEHLSREPSSTNRYSYRTVVSNITVR